MFDLVMAQSSQSIGPPPNAGRFNHWEHRIKVEKRHPPDPILSASALCLAGANAAPPEDVGGAPGYADFLEAILDPDHPEHHAMRTWCGDDFEPGRFDLSEENERLERLKG